MSYIVEVYADNHWVRNHLVFDTKQEAEAYGSDLFSRWMGIREYRSVHIDHPANYTFVAGKLEQIHG